MSDQPALAPRAPTPRSVPSQSPGAPRRPSGPVDAVAHSLVGEFLTERKEERAAAALRARPGPPWRRIAAIAAIVACAAAWVIPSLGSGPAPSVSVERQDASARLTLFLASQRLRDFAKRNGRLPSSTVQGGVNDPRISYRLTGPNTFLLSLIEQGKRWELSSSAADSTYMREALAQLGVIKGKRP